MSIVLKSCPFCGHIPKHKTSKLKTWFMVACGNRKCRVAPFVWDFESNKDEVIFSWNNRGRKIPLDKSKSIC